MTQFIVPEVNWSVALANLIKQAQDGDEIVVSSRDQAALAERARQRLCPEKEIVFLVDVP